MNHCFPQERGVDLIKQGRTADAFRRFSKALKMLIATEPLDPKVVSEQVVKDMVELKVMLNNVVVLMMKMNVVVLIL